MKAWIGAVALAGVLLSGGAGATDGNTLLRNCQTTVRMMDEEKIAPKDTIDIGQCLGMVEGVRSTFLIYDKQLPKYLRICLPDGGISNGQAVRIVSKFLRDNPAQLNLDATFLISVAYQDAYPCK